MGAEFVVNYSFENSSTNTLGMLLLHVTVCCLVHCSDALINRQGAVHMIKCCDCQATYIGETARNLNTRLSDHKGAARNVIC